MESPFSGGGGSAELDGAPSSQSLRGLDWFTFFLGDMQSGFGPFISVYLVTQKWTQTEIGIILSIGAIVSLICQIPGGAILDAVRSERMTAAAAVIAICFSAFVIAIAPIFVAVAAARSLHALASALLGPAVGAITLGLVGRRALPARLGRNARFASAGNGAAAMIMGALGHFISAQAVFFATAGFALPALTALFRIKDQEVNPVQAHGGGSPGERPAILVGLGELFAKRALWVFLGVIILFQMANAPMLPLAGSELTSRSASWAVPLIAACIVVPQILVALFSPWVGTLAETIGRRPLLLAALGVLPLRGLLFAYSSDPSAIVAVQMLDGVSAAVLGVLIPLIIADISYGTGHFNLGQGVTGMAIGIAAAISTSAAGYLADSLGSRIAFLAMAGTALCGFLLLALLMPETRPRDR
jgi:MFS family permease